LRRGEIADRSRTPNGKPMRDRLAARRFEKYTSNNVMQEERE
jgi:hypothetical protein